MTRKQLIWIKFRNVLSYLYSIDVLLLLVSFVFFSLLFLRTSCEIEIMFSCNWLSKGKNRKYKACILWVKLFAIPIWWIIQLRAIYSFLINLKRLRVFHVIQKADTAQQLNILFMSLAFFLTFEFWKLRKLVCFYFLFCYVLIFLKIKFFGGFFIFSS